MLDNTATIFAISNFEIGGIQYIECQSKQENGLLYSFGGEGLCWGNKHLTAQTRGFLESVGKGEKKTCQDLRCLPKTLASARRSVPSSKMSSRSIDVTPPAPSESETESAPIGPQATPRTCVTSGGAAAILSVASGSRALQKCSSPWLPSRRFSLGAAGALGERPPQAWALLLALSPLPLHLDGAGALSAFPGR